MLLSVKHYSNQKVTYFDDLRCNSPPLQEHITVAPVVVSQDTWELAVSVRKVMPAAYTSAPVGKLRVSRSAVDGASAAATSACATSRSLEKSMAASVSVMTSPAAVTKDFSAQVRTSLCFTVEGVLQLSWVENAT